MPTTTKRTLTMSTVLKTRSVGLCLVSVTVFRYVSTPARERESEQIREQQP